MDEAEEFALVVKAVTCGTIGCFEWASERLLIRVRNAPDLKGLTPPGIKKEVKTFALGPSGLKQVVETRPEYRGDHRFYYKAVIPLDDFPIGLFVEMVLIDRDPDCPVVHIVNVHPQPPR